MRTEKDVWRAAGSKVAEEAYEAGWRAGLRVSADSARAVVYPQQGTTPLTYDPRSASGFSVGGYVKPNGPYAGYAATPWGLFEPSQGTFKAT